MYAVFDDVRPMRRGRSKAASIVSRDAERNPDRIYGRWSPETAEEKRRINRECAEAAGRMMPRIEEMLAKRAAAREAEAHRETQERK